MNAPRTLFDDVALLGDITAFAGRMLAKPLALPPGDWAEAIEAFDQKLHAAVVESAHRSFVGNFAPVLLTAMRASVAAHRCRDRCAPRWDSLIGHLVPCVREDADALLAKAEEA